MWWPQTIALSLSFLTDSSLVLCSATVLVTTGSMRRYLQPNQVSQVVQFLQDVARRFAVSPSTVSRAWRRCQETDCYAKRAGLNWYSQENTRIGRSATGTLFSSQMRSGSHWTHVTGVRESGDIMVKIKFGGWMKSSEWLLTLRSVGDLFIFNRGAGPMGAPPCPDTPHLCAPSKGHCYRTP